MSPKPTYIDGHIHLSLFDRDALEPYLKAAHDVGITRFLQGGYKPADWLRQSELKNKMGASLVTCFGLHPWHVIDSTESQLDQDFALFEEKAASADTLGEMGLDRFYKAQGIDSRARQVKYFRQQLEVAKRLGKPVCFHVVKAYGEALDILREDRPHFPGLMHSFAGSIEVAREYRKMGFFISVGPGILHLGFQKLKQAVAELDIEDFILESDAPHAGHEDEGQNLDPRLLFRIGQAVADMKGTTLEKVLETSNRNILSLFKN